MKKQGKLPRIVKRVLILEPEDILLYENLSPQQKALQEISTIRRFLAGRFEGEYMYQRDQDIIDKFTNLKTEDEKNGVSRRLREAGLYVRLNSQYFE